MDVVFFYQTMAVIKMTLGGSPQSTACPHPRPCASSCSRQEQVDSQHQCVLYQWLVLDLHW